jgi:REP element-mobilizing transposase RayT
MSHTYASNRVHIVFSTKGRMKNLADDLQPKLWGYMKGIAKNHGFEAVKIGGVSDHIHALLVVPPAMALAKAVQSIKGCSSKWIHDTGAAGENFAWQEGYGAFSVSASQTEGVVTYIENQAAHHARRNYEEEFVELLRKYGIAYDPAHVLG